MTEPKFTDSKAFKTCDNKGFHITFPNGITLSTQFGYGNYCENYDKGNFDIDRERGRESNTAEIAIFKDGGKKWLTDEWSKNDDMVEGYVAIERWLSAFDFCRNYRSKGEGGR